MQQSNREKQRIVEGSVSPEAFEFYQEQRKKHDRGASYFLNKAILFAKDKGFDLGNTQTRETVGAAGRAVRR